MSNDFYLLVITAIFCIVMSGLTLALMYSLMVTPCQIHIFQIC
jgi:hypothetical protein